MKKIERIETLNLVGGQNDELFGTKINDLIDFCNSLQDKSGGEECKNCWDNRFEKCPCPCHKVKEERGLVGELADVIPHQGEILHQESDWEKELDLKTMGNSTFDYNNGALRKQVKEFIRQTLESQKTRLIEAVKGKRNSRIDNSLIRSNKNK